MGESPSSSARATWARSTCRGEGSTGEPSCQRTSQRTSAVPSSQGILRNEARSGLSAKSPKPRSQPAISYPGTGSISISSASR